MASVLLCVYMAIGTNGLYLHIYIYISLLVALVVMEVMVMVVSGVGVLKTRRDGIIL